MQGSVVQHTPFLNRSDKRQSTGNTIRTNVVAPFCWAGQRRNRATSTVTAPIVPIIAATVIARIGHAIIIQIECFRVLRNIKHPFLNWLLSPARQLRNGLIYDDHISTNKTESADT